MNIGVIILAVAIILIPVAYLFDKWNDKDFRAMERQIREADAERAALTKRL